MTAAYLLSIRHHNPDHSRVVVYEELRLKHELHGVHHVLLSLEVGVWGLAGITTVPEGTYRDKPL
jgi:hypothetical protein